VNQLAKQLTQTDVDRFRALFRALDVANRSVPEWGNRSCDCFARLLARVSPQCMLVGARIVQGRNRCRRSRSETHETWLDDCKRGAARRLLHAWS
jgi:hypothetical protein